MLDYNDFSNAYISKLQDRIPMADIERHTVQKINTSMEAISFRFPDSNISPTIYLQSQYKLYEDGVNIDDLVEKTIETVERARSEAPTMPDLSLESVKQNLYAIVINAEQNKELLENCPHEKIEDLAVVARMRVGENGSIQITDKICESIGLTSEECIEIAKRNSSKEAYEVTNIMSALGMDDEFSSEMMPIFVVTNQSKHFGAVTICYEDVLNQVADRLGEDNLLIIPSSVHEILVIPESKAPDIESLQEMVRMVNGDCVEPNEVLSDHVYRFDAKEMELSRADSVKVELPESVIKESHRARH